MRSLLAPMLLLLAACGSANSQTAALPKGTKADRLLVDKSERVLIAYAGNREIVRYKHIRFGDAPTGHKQFEGDERTPEGRTGSAAATRPAPIICRCAYPTPTPPTAPLPRRRDARPAVTSSSMASPTPGPDRRSRATGPTAVLPCRTPR